MSVLFKALSRAAEENRLRHAAAATPSIPVLQTLRRDRRAWRVAFVGSAAALVVVGAAGLALIDQSSAPADAITRPAPAAPSAESVQADPAAHQPSTPPSPAAAAPAAASPAPPPQTPVQRPVEVATPTPPPAPQPPPQPATSATVAPSADLPAVLEGIRRRQLGKGVASPVSVQHAPAAPAAAGNGALSVDVVATTARDDVTMAYDALVQGRFERALELYSAASDKEPRNVTALVGRASVLHKLGQLDEARAAYGRALAVDPDNPQAMSNMLSLVAASAPQEALRELARLRGINPRFSPIPAQMASVHARLGDVSQAMLSLKDAIALSPENAIYRYNLAILQDRAGLRGEAIETYERVLAGGGAAATLPLDQIRERVRFLRGSR